MQILTCLFETNGHVSGHVTNYITHFPVKIIQGGRTHVWWNIYEVGQQAQAEDWNKSKQATIDYTELNNEKMD